MKRTISFLVLLLSVFQISCSSAPSSEITGAPIDPRVRAEQEGEIKIADDALAKRDFESAQTLYLQFKNRFPNSVYYQRAQFGQAKALEELDQWAEAAELYRKTAEATRERQKNIAAQALYQLSFCYENLGDEARVLASLKDAQNMSEYLTPEQAYAEVPARLAASYNRMGLTKEAHENLKKADAGVAEVRAKLAQEVTPQWIAQIYQKMGSFSTNQLSQENLQASLDTLKMVQIFSLRSAEADSDPWSSIAVQGLMENYRDIWNTIQSIPLNTAMDPGAAKRERNERWTHFTGQLLTMMNDLRLYKMPEHKDPKGSLATLFSFLKKLETSGRDLLMSMGEQNPLTPDAKRKQALRRDGLTVKPVQTETETTLPKKLPEKDPNL